jgi:hypothetical protein
MVTSLATRVNRGQRRASVTRSDNRRSVQRVARALGARQGCCTSRHQARRPALDSVAHRATPRAEPAVPLHRNVPRLRHLAAPGALARIGNVFCYVAGFIPTARPSVPRYLRHISRPSGRTGPYFKTPWPPRCALGSHPPASAATKMDEILNPKPVATSVATKPDAVKLN